MAEVVIFVTSSWLARFVLFIILFGLMLILFGALKVKSKPLGRFGFGLFYVTFAMTQVVLPPVFIAVAEENVDTAAVVWLVVLALSVAILAQMSRRRALDAFGDTGNAYLAAIPLVLLILVFKKPRNSARIEYRTTAAFAGRSFMFALCTIGVVFLGSFFKGILDAMNRDAVVNVSNMPLKRSVRILSALFDADAPQYIDSKTVLTGSTSEGTGLVLKYMVIDDSGELIPQVFEAVTDIMVKQNVCSNPLFSDLVYRGAVIIFEYSVYSKPNTYQPHLFKVTVTDCI